MTRREERIEAFKIIYQNLFTSSEFIFNDDTRLGDFTKSLVSAVEENKEMLMNEIKSNIKDNKRIFHIDLAIILLAVAEFKFGISPKEVAVNEAVEIAKIYSTDESPSFINAFLKAMI